MNRSLRLFAALTLCAALGFATLARAEDMPADAASGKPLKDAIQPSATYATVNGQPIKGTDLQAFITKLPPQLQTAPSDRLMDMIVNQMVNDRLVAKAAADENLADDAKTKQMIKEAGEQVIRDRYVEKKLEGKVTDAAVRAKYDEVMKSTPDQEEVRASHILVSDEKTANEVIAKLNKGGDFAALAKQYSIDPTKANGGDLGFFTRGAMVKEFGDAAFSMKKGEVSKTPVKSQFGWHIIKVVDRRKMVRPSFDQVKDRIRAQLTDEQIKSIVQDLRAKNKVEITIPKS